MDNNKMAEVAKLLGVELDEEFDIAGSIYNPHKITLKGLIDCGNARSDNWLHRLLRGGGKIIKRPWKPKICDEYWTVDANSKSSHCYEFHAGDLDYCRMKCGNCFKTREEAEANIERIKAETEEFFAYVK